MMFCVRVLLFFDFRILKVREKLCPVVFLGPEDYLVN